MNREDQATTDLGGGATELRMGVAAAKLWAKSASQSSLPANQRLRGGGGSLSVAAGEALDLRGGGKVRGAAARARVVGGPPLLPDCRSRLSIAPLPQLAAVVRIARAGSSGARGTGGGASGGHDTDIGCWLSWQCRGETDTNVE
jgi:hypothetical protein